MQKPFLHEHQDFKIICEVARDETRETGTVMDFESAHSHLLTKERVGYHMIVLEGDQ